MGDNTIRQAFRSAILDNHYYLVHNKELEKRSRLYRKMFSFLLAGRAAQRGFAAALSGGWREMRGVRASVVLVPSKAAPEALVPIARNYRIGPV